MTYIADLDPNNPAIARAEALVDFFDAEFPAWESREAYGDTVLSERDFPVYDASADESRVPNEDWEAVAEDFWNDDKFM